MKKLMKLIADKGFSERERHVLIAAVTFAKDHEDQFVKQFGTYGLELLDEMVDEAC